MKSQILDDQSYLCIAMEASGFHVWGMAHLEAASRIQEPVSLLHIVDLLLQQANLVVLRPLYLDIPAPKK